MTDPTAILFAGERPFPVIPACVHVAGTPRRIEKSLQLQEEMTGAFDLTMDLEDGAPLGREEEHAKEIAGLLRDAAALPGRRGVRIHDGAHAAWHRDVEIVLKAAAGALAYVTLPKVARLEQARAMASAVQDAARSAGRASPVPVHVLIETHGGLRDVHALAALPNVEALDFGLMDFVSAHRGAIPESAMRSPGQFEHALVRRAKAELAAAALGAGVVPSHNVTIDYRSPSQAADDARRARDELGYLRMWSIHPDQIRPILEAFRPDGGEVERAAAVLSAAAAASWGPVAHEGRLYDRASYRYLWEMLRRARLAGAPLPEGPWNR